MMTKKIMFGAVVVLLSGSTALAQTQYDAARIMDTDLNGTARFVGMGGAMSALGGEISTIGSNPAGIGLYRSNDFSGTISLNDTEVKSDFAGVTGKDNRSRMSFDQLGVVFSNKIGNETTVRYVNVGVNYRKQRNFNRRAVMYGNLEGMSLSDQIAHLANNVYDEKEREYLPLLESDYYKMYDNPEGNYYTDDRYRYVSWLGILGATGGIISPQYTPIQQKDDNGNLIFDEQGNPLYEVDEYGNLLYEYNYVGIGGNDVKYKSQETGGINVFDFNLSANVNDRVYWGLTVEFHDVNYRRSSLYSETFDAFNEIGIPTDFVLNNDFLTEGSGVNAKLGVIFRPLEESAFRMGLAIHTPTLYKLSERYSASLSVLEEGEMYKPYTEVATFDYDLVTPWKFNFSLGHTIGTSVALGAEYEYTDYSSAELRYDDGFEMANENDWVNEYLKGVHTVRVGAEVKVIPEFSLRAGYNYSSSVFEKDSYRSFFYDDTRTDAEYENMMARNTFTLGMGFRSGQLYLDAAFLYTNQKSEFYPFDSWFSYNDALVDYPTTADGLLPPTKMTNERTQLLLTVGYRF